MWALGVNSGAETATLWLARTLARRGARVVLAARVKEGRDLADQGVEFWNLGDGYAVSKLLDRAKTELGTYHLLSVCKILSVALAAERPECLSRTFMAHDPSASAAGLKPDIICKMADNVFCVSEAQKGLFVNAGGDAEKILVVPNGADLETFSPGDPEKRDYKRLIFVGALVVDKGIHVLVNVFARLRQKHPTLKLDVYGSAAMWGREELFSIAEVEKQVQGIKFHGPIPQTEVTKHYQTAGACVVPSIYFDSFPLAAIEANVCGCPVIGFNAGGIREAILHNKTGYIIPETSEEALFKALDELVSAPERLKAMSREALEYSRKTFTWDRVAEAIEAATIQRSPATSAKGKLGIVTTWNQRCGLAKFSAAMMGVYDSSNYVVLAERTDRREGTDGSNVERCWDRNISDYSGIEAAVRRHGLTALHLYCHTRFFKQPNFSEFCLKMRRSGVKIIAHLHSSYTFEYQLSELVSQVDEVVVHTPENRLEVIAAGAEPDRVHVVPLGITTLPTPDSSAIPELRRKLNLPIDKKIILSTGFIQAAKGMEAVIEAVHHLKSKNIPVHGIIAGSVPKDDPSAPQYAADLKTLVSNAGLASDISIIEEFISDEKMMEYLQAADLVYLNYRWQHFESTGAGAVALGAGALVVASLAPHFMPFHDAVWHLTSGYPAGLSAELLLRNPLLRQEIKARAAEYCKQHSWENIAVKFAPIYSKCGVQLPRAVNVAKAPKAIAALDIKDKKENKMSNEKISMEGKMRVLIQNRPGTFSQRGGDTVVIERLAAGLKSRGVDVVVDTEARENPANFDLVHLFNFATPDYTRALAERAKSAYRPYVVTSLFEDISIFHNQSITASQALIQYVQRGQSAEWYAANRPNTAAIQGCPPFDCGWLAENAAALFTTGQAESDAIKRYFPRTKQPTVVPLGHEVGAAGDSSLFERTYGIKDFVLCVGRLETRKNQLMLLKALESSEIPVVLVAGDFTYQPEYAAAVRAFKRKGQTIVLERLSAEMLASAYAACRIHALPSWFELPGLVSLEAGAAGKNVVASQNGTGADCMKEFAFYVDPGSEQSIRNGIMAAFYAPVRPEFITLCRSQTWDAMVDQTIANYAKITGRSVQAAKVAETSKPVLAAPAPSTPKESTPVTPATGYSRERIYIPADGEILLASVENALSAGDEAGTVKAIEICESRGVKHPRFSRAKAARHLSKGEFPQARSCYEHALVLDPADVKSICGKGMCAQAENKLDEAHSLYAEAARKEPTSLIMIRQLVESSFKLGKYADLSAVLTQYTTANPTDIEMKFCMAGCMYKLNDITGAQRLASEVLKVKADHRGATELVAKIGEDRARAAARIGTTPTSFAQSASIPAAPVTPKLQVQREVLAPRPSDIDSQVAMLEEHKRNENFLAVHDEVTRLLMNPALTQAHRETVRCIDAEVAATEGRLDEARDCYRAILLANPSSARGLCGKAALDAHAAKWSEARGGFEKALAIRPGYDVALAGLAVCAQAEGKFEDAWTLYSKALGANSENTRALLGLIEIGYKLKRLSDVESALRSYLEIHPADLNFLYSLAGCCYAQEKIDEAVEALDTIKLFDPNHGMMNELRGVIEKRRDTVDLA
jgi:glycosyltransferase involved in cell wall biosynthesis/tetratricopeptide (TPR) repeat protein